MTGGRWRYGLYDLLTGTPILDHLPLEVDSVTRMLGEAGTLSSSLPLGDAAIRARHPRELVLPRRTNLVVFRDETPVWDGIIWTRRRKRAAKTNEVEFGSAEIRSYLDHRLLRPELGYGSAKTIAFTADDVFNVFRTLIADAQTITINGAQPGNIGIELDDSLSGHLIDRRDTATDQSAYHGYTFTSYGQLLTDLVETEGMEWRVDPYLDGDRNLRRRLLLGYPRLGVPADSPALLTLEYPGQILEYEWPDDGETSYNYVAALGIGDGDNMLWAQAISTAELAAGYPLLETSLSYKDDTSLGILQSRADAGLAAAVGDRTVPSLLVQGYVPVVPGDHVRVRLRDEDWFVGSAASPYEAVIRIVGVSYKPGPPEQTTLTIEEPRS